MDTLATVGSTFLAYQQWELAQRWRDEDVVQRRLNNVRREMDEKIEQLKGISSIAALVAGFDVVVLIELDFPGHVPEWLLALLGFSTALTVCLMSLAFVTCTLMTVGVLKAYDVHNIREPFYDFWLKQCEEDWQRSLFFFTIGVPAFIANLSVAAWVKFYEHVATASIVTGICGAGILMWLFVHLKWGKYITESPERSARRCSEEWDYEEARLENGASRRIEDSGQSQSMEYEGKEVAESFSVEAGADPPATPEAV